MLPLCRPVTCVPLRTAENGHHAWARDTTEEDRRVKMLRVLRAVKVDGRWEKLPVARVRGQMDWTHVEKKGQRIPAPEGTFYLEFRENGRKARRAVGNTVREAKAAMVTHATVLELRARGVDAGDAPEMRPRRQDVLLEGRKIAEVAEGFRKAPALGLRAKSVQGYLRDLVLFQGWAKAEGKTHLVQLGRQDIRDFMAWLVRSEGLAIRTAKNKAVTVLKRLRDAGAAIAMEKGDWPKVTERQPEVYTPEQLRPFFAGCTRREFVLFQTFLLTGFREQEIGYLARPDFNARGGTLRVSKKKGYTFDPKNYMERTIQIFPALVELLKAHIAALAPDDFLIFGTSRHNIGRGLTGGMRDKHMLLKLKKIALRTGLNCGRCTAMYEKKTVSCRDRPVCAVWTLHKFRHTYATTLLRDGYDIVTVQKLLGHQEIASTMKYLRMLQAESLTKKMGESTIPGMFV